MTVPVSRYGEQLPRPPSAQMLVDRARDSVVGYIAMVAVSYTHLTLPTIYSV